MIAVRETVFNNMRGQEVSFYTGEDVGKNIFLTGEKLEGEDTFSKKVMAEISPGLGGNLAIGAGYTVDAINQSLKRVYHAYEHCNPNRPSSENLNEALPTQAYYSRYHLGIQELVYLLNKFCYLLFCLKADRIVPNHGQFPLSFGEILDNANPNPYKDEIFKALFPNNDFQLFKIIEDVNTAFQSCFMFAQINQIGAQYPTICAYSQIGRPDCAFILHNHSVWQIINGLNIHLKTLNLL